MTFKQHGSRLSISKRKACPWVSLSLGNSLLLLIIFGKQHKVIWQGSKFTHIMILTKNLQFIAYFENVLRSGWEGAWACGHFVILILIGQFLRFLSLVPMVCYCLIWQPRWSTLAEIEHLLPCHSCSRDIAVTQVT